MANFYCFMFILHPKRIVKLILNTIKGTPATKLEGVVSRVIKTLKYRHSRESGNPFNKGVFSSERENTQIGRKANWVRKQVLEMIASAGKGHIGGAFSCIDILVALYYGGIFTIQS